jgi:hypothetical protein
MTQPQPDTQLLVSQAPLRYRLRAKLLFQTGALPRNVRRHIMRTFPCMCGLKTRRDLARV